MASEMDEAEVEDRVLPARPASESKLAYKSWRKKYRKLRLKFDESMKDSEAMFLQEHKTWEIARRLQEQNDQILDILLEINDATHMPASWRYNVGALPPRLAALPELEADQSDEASTRDGVSLAALEKKARHSQQHLTSPTLFPSDMIEEDDRQPPGYMTPAHQTSYLSALDSTLQEYDASDLGADEKAIAAASAKTAKDFNFVESFALDNPISVHNWLRRNKPQVFENADKPVKPTPERGNRRGKEKEKVEKVEKAAACEEPVDPLDEELGYDPRQDVAFGSGRGKRKKDDDAYRPKGGGGRSSKRKRDREDGESKTTKKAKKASLAAEVTEEA